MHLNDDRTVVLGKTGQPVPPTYLDPTFASLPSQRLGQLSLRRDEHVHPRVHGLAEVHRQRTEREFRDRVGAIAGARQLFVEPPVVKQTRPLSRHTGGPRPQVRPGRRIEHQGLNPSQSEFAGEHEAVRPCPGDENVDHDAAPLSVRAGKPAQKRSSTS
ncbi:Uncharacterised protein [Mycobacteroides abscessus subsp. abscessus]|nr:Uncharacterised protein [Mycobacteroides abscessus subsp. abscessus]